MGGDGEGAVPREDLASGGRGQQVEFLGVVTGDEKEVARAEAAAGAAVFAELGNGLGREAEGIALFPIGIKGDDAALGGIARFGILGEAGEPGPVAPIHPGEGAFDVAEVDGLQVLHGGGVPDLDRALHRHGGVVGVGAPEFAIEDEARVEVFEVAVWLGLPAADFFASGFGVFADGGIGDGVKMGGIHGHALMGFSSGEAVLFVVSPKAGRVWRRRQDLGETEDQKQQVKKGGFHQEE